MRQQKSQQPQQQQQDPLQMLAGLLGMIMQAGEYEMKVGKDQRDARNEGIQQGFAETELQQRGEYNKFQMDKWTEQMEQQQTNQLVQLLGSPYANPMVNPDVANQQFQQSGLMGLLNPMAKQAQGTVLGDSYQSPELRRLRQEGGK